VQTMPHLEEVRLLHYTEEFLLVHLAVTVAIGFIDHFLQLFVHHPLAELRLDVVDDRDVVSVDVDDSVTVESRRRC